MADEKITGSVEERAKELLADPTRRIELDDLVNEVLATALEALSPDHFPINGEPSRQKEFVRRIAAYEAALGDLLPLTVLLVRWADEDGLLQLEKIISRLAETAPGDNGLVLWLRLRWYPLLVVMYAAGIAALATHRHKALVAVLTVPISEDGGQTNPQLKPAVLHVPSRVLEVNDAFNWLPDCGRHYLPLSEHLFAVLKPVLDRLLFLRFAYERHFDRFELLAALTFTDIKNPSSDGSILTIPGRFVYKSEHQSNPYTTLLGEAEVAGTDWSLLASGLFGGSLVRLRAAVEGYRQKGSHWRGG